MNPNPASFLRHVLAAVLPLAMTIAGAACGGPDFTEGATGPQSEDTGTAAADDADNTPIILPPDKPAAPATSDDGGDSGIVGTGGGATMDADLGDATEASSDGGTTAPVDAPEEKIVEVGANVDEGASHDGGGGCLATELLCNGGCVPNNTYNCGACGHDCTGLPHVSGSVTCLAAGACYFPLSSCAPGWTHCAGNADLGCETDESTTTNCGSCGTVCSIAAPLCSAAADAGFACASGCPVSTPTLCSGSCVDATSSAAHCGACANVCTTSVAHAQAACVASACTITCNTSYTLCGGACVDEQLDPGHCGTCGTTCTGNAPVCLGGACVACSPKATQCSGAVPQTCDAAGAWQSGSVTAGLCGALCAPTAARCSGNNVQACGSDGRWQTTRNCPKCSGAGQCIPAVAVGAGGYHTCAALSDGTVACWGENQHGELGNGSTSTGPTSSPVAVSGLSGVTAVSLGDQHSCALVSSGAVECWGEGTNGELGNGAMTNSSNPVLASGLSGVVSVSVGLYYSSALLSNGTVQSWGNNGNGSLGNQPTALCPFGFSTCAWTPILLTNVSGVSAIAAGNSSQCALLSSGTVECWGFNGDGELGNGTTSNGSGTPVAVSNLSGAVGISSGDGHACARLSDGTVACWGANSSGQLGNGSTNESSVPVPVSSLSGVSATATGGHFSCALLSGGTVRCWGENVHGQLGNGPTTGLSMPVPVGVSSLSGATAIAAGYEHACALLSSGAVACWGYNGWGQLGNGLTADSSMPVTVTW